MVADDGVKEGMSGYGLRPVTLQSPAKINLFLKIVAKRPDGYHDLFSLMCAIGLYDYIHIRPGEHTVSITCAHPDVPEDESNLAARAVLKFYEVIGMNPPGIHIEIQKKIPVGAGLGGGSSNAATVLTALNRFLNNPLPGPVLKKIGSGLGADVPFFLSGEPALASGIGDQLQAIGPICPYHVVIVDPMIPVNTGKVYKSFKLRLTKCEKINNELKFKKSCLDPIDYLCNDLETVTARMHPEINQIKDALCAAGARGACMSGSGSSVFGLFDDRAKANQACHQLAGNSGWRAFVAELLS